MIIPIILCVVFICSFLVLPLFHPVSRNARLAGILLGLATLLALVTLHFDSSTLGIPFALSMGSGIHFAKKAWREFDDRRMVLRAEAYQAKIDAQ